MNGNLGKEAKKVALILSLGVAAFYIGQSLAVSPDIGAAILVAIPAAVACLFIVTREDYDRQFLIRLFLGALCLRWFIGGLIYYKGWQSFLGPDATSYDFFGNEFLRSWQGMLDPNTRWLASHTSIYRSGWGMNYYVATIYLIAGRNLLAVLLVNCVLGAAACVIVYKIAFAVYPQQRVARLAALLTAFSPSMVLWTSQALKEAPIILCLCLCTYLSLKLCRKFDLLGFTFLMLTLFCLYSLRHYAFYITFVAIAGAFLFANRQFTLARTLQGAALILVIGLTFAYFGADEVAQKSFDLKRLQGARAWGAKAADSGFAGDVSITDSRTALSYLPIGTTYVLFAPFPWMMTKTSQLITLPEMILWWLAAPLLVWGYWFAIKHRLRESLPICLFTVGLTLVYALFLTNVGTVHRQRTQLLVFFYIFISIGWEQWRIASLQKKAHRVPVRIGFGSMANANSRQIK